MAELSRIYSLGDIIIHRSYGVGKIISIESKSINGVEVECFKVETENGNYWFPTKRVDNPRIHPVASQEIVQKAIEILRSAPEGLEDDPLQWKTRISDVQTQGDFLAVSGLVRDLAALKIKRKRLNQTQDQALKRLEDRLLREWAASANIDVNSIRPKFEAYLKESKAYYQDGI